MASIREAAGGKYEVRDHKGNSKHRTSDIEEALRVKDDLEKGEPEAHFNTKRCRAHHEALDRPLQFEWLKRRWG